MTEDPSRSRSARHLESKYRGLASASAIFGLLFGLGAFTVAAVFMGFDYFSVRGRPTEHAVVISVGPSGTKETCGYRALSPDTPGERTTYRSQDPPEGLPAEFSVTHCPDWDDQVGDVVPVRRTGPDRDDVYPEPIESAGQWLGMAGIVGIATGVVVATLTALKEAWSAHRAERKIRRNRDDRGA